MLIILHYVVNCVFNVPYNFVKDFNAKIAIDCILIDEIHFFSPEQIWQLSDIVDDLNIPVICYGLRSNYLGRPFDTTALLLAIADTLEEVKNYLLLR